MNPFKYLYLGIKSIIKFIILWSKYFIIGLITLITIFPYYTIVGSKFIFSKKSQNNELKKLEKKFIPITILTLSIITYLTSVFILTRWYVQSERSKNFTKDFEQIVNTMPPSTEDTTTDNSPEEEIETPNQYEDSTPITPAPEINNTPTYTEPTINKNFINVNLNYYIQKNQETVSWIQVNGTKVNYPVVQHNDNDFYLKHDFYKRKTANGWIFADYRNNFETFDNNTIIYGHNLINNGMFGALMSMLNKSFFANPNNHYIKLSTQNTNSVWQIFSVYKIAPTTDYLQVKFNSTTNYQEFLDTLTKRSYYQFGLDLNYTDKIITLSTCDNTGTKRVVIHAKLINIESK